MTSTPTHIDFQGHHGFQIDALFDLHQHTDPDDKHHWGVEHWKREAQSWAMRDDLLINLKEMATRRTDAKDILGRSEDDFLAKPPAVNVARRSTSI